MTAEKARRVLLVVNEVDWFWSHRLPLAKEILSEKHHLILASHEACSDTELDKFGIDAVNIPRISSNFNPYAHLKLLVSLARTLMTVKPDLVHVITIRYAIYVGLVAKIIRYKPVIVTVAGLGSLFSSPTLKMRTLRFFLTPLLRFALGGEGRLNIFQNPDDRENLLELKIGRADQAFLIRGSGVDIKDYPFVPYQESIHPPKVLFASRLLRDKGVSSVIEAARILKEQNVPIEFIIAGGLIDGNSRFISRKEIENAHAEGVVNWLGNVSSVAQLMQESIMVVFPSFYGEGVPKVLLEAAATGRPIITCDVPGCREAVIDGLNGILIPPKNPNALAQEIVALIADKPKRHAQGEAGRRMVEQEFRTELVIKQTMEVYSQALALPDNAECIEEL